MPRTFSIILVLLLFSVHAVANDLICPPLKPVKSKVPGIHFILLCHRHPAAINTSSLSRETTLIPSTFDTFRDGPSFDWKSPVIIWNKQSAKTQFQKGFVTLTKGETIEGEIQLKAVQGELEEITVRPAGSKKKKKHKISKISSFGLSPEDGHLFEIDENFSPGRIELRSGEIIEGGIWFITIDRLVYQLENKQVVQLSTNDIQWFTVDTDDGSQSFVARDGVFAKVIVDAAPWALAINPNPQPLKKKGGFGNFLAKQATQAVADQIVKGVAQGVASATNSIDATLIAAEATAAMTDAYMVNPKKFRREYYLVHRTSGESALVHTDILQEVVTPLTRDCTGFSGVPAVKKKKQFEESVFIQVTEEMNACPEIFRD